MSKIVELLQKRAKLVADAREMLEHSDPKDKEAMAKYDAMIADAQGISTQVQRMQQQDAFEAELDKTSDPTTLAAVRGGRTIGSAAAVERQALEAFRSGGYEAVSEGEQRKALNALQTRAYLGWLRHGADAMTPEFRAALNVTDLTRGGYVRPPQTVVQGILAAADDQVFLRQFATKIQSWEGGSAGQVSLETDLDDFEWSTELPASITEDDKLKLGKRELTCNPFRKRIKVSKTLLNMPGFDMLALINRRLGYKVGITQEKAYLLGSGVKKPLGLFVATADGIPTSRDTVCGGATAITFDGLKSCRGALKQQYRRNARWLFHRDAVTMISKLRTDEGGAGTGPYLWEPSVQVGQPDQLLSFPILESEYVPNTFTSTLYIGMIADFSFYYILDGLDMQVQRLVELYAETNMDGLIANVSGDGMPVLSEAFVRMKLG
jgi:HK97 family phage major capsid protein